MARSVPDPKPRTRHKTFTYRTWLRRAGPRTGVLGSEGKSAVQVSGPPVYKREAGAWTPEDLLVGAVQTCLMSTFLAFAERQRLPVVSYDCDAEGVLELVDGAYRFSRVLLRPRVVVADTVAIEQASKALHDAHASCIIARSIRADVILSPLVRHEAARERSSDELATELPTE